MLISKKVRKRLKSGRLTVSVKVIAHDGAAQQKTTKGKLKLLL